MNASVKEPLGIFPKTEGSLAKITIFVLQTMEWALDW